MRQKNRKGKYTRKIFLRVTERDYKRIKTYAEKEKLSIPAFMVKQSTINYLPAATDEKLLLAIHNLLTSYIAQLRGMGTNLNQLAHWANRERTFPIEAQVLTNQINETLKEINTITSKVREQL